MFTYCSVVVWQTYNKVLFYLIYQRFATSVLGDSKGIKLVKVILQLS